MDPMAPAWRVLVGVALVAAVAAGLWGTFDYAKETSERSFSQPTDAPARPSETQRLGRAIADARPLRGMRQLVNQLNRIGLKRAAVLAGERPSRLSVTFTGEQDVAARTFYEVDGRTVSLGQVFGAPLPAAGGLVRLPSDRVAVEVDDVLYWAERGYVLTIPSDARNLVGRLRWRGAGDPRADRAP